jgi:DNA-binding GntR family transcriptional regulator
MTDDAGGRGPKYRRIADDLRARIGAGEFNTTGRLPTKDQLGKHYGAAVNTVERALEELRKAGLAESIQGSGTFVRQPKPAQPSQELGAVLARLDAVEQQLADLARRFDESGRLREIGPPATS